MRGPHEYRVVHFDVDSLVLQNFDELFDDDPTVGGAVYHLQLSVQQRRTSRSAIRPSARTGRYLCPVHHGLEHGPETVGEYPPVQGGFVIARPSLVVYEEMVNIVRKDNSKVGGAAHGRAPSTAA